MRFKIRPNKPKPPSLGDTRVLEKFLWFPTLQYFEGQDNAGQVRWLEKAKIKQVYQQVWECAPEVKPYKTIKWISVWWAE